MMKNEPWNAKKWIQFGVILIGIAVGIVFHEKLVDWFRGGTFTRSMKSKDRADHSEHFNEEVAYYTCPMHPSVKQNAPGHCPICGMDLTPVTRKSLSSGEVLLSQEQREAVGLHTAEVKTRTVHKSIRALGEIAYDETALFDVNLRISGWVEQLWVDRTWQRVQKGQKLFSIYSPELYAAQLEYLSAISSSSKGLSSSDLLVGAKERLRLLGMSRWQINQLKNKRRAYETVPFYASSSGVVIEKNVVQGAKVEEGTRAYRIARLSPIWVEAEVFETDLSLIQKNQPVEVFFPDVRLEKRSGEISEVYPQLDPNTRAGKIRVVLENQSFDLKPHMFAEVYIQIGQREILSVPESAVVYTGPRHLVFVEVRENVMVPREVKVGLHAEGYYEIRSGLQGGERVVSSAAFLIAAESRIRSALEYWEATDDSQ